MRKFEAGGYKRCPLGLRGDGLGEVAGWIYLRKFHLLLWRVLQIAPDGAREEVSQMPLKGKLKQIDNGLRKAQEKRKKENVDEEGV